MNQERIGRFIAKCRKEKNITQAQLAKKLGVSDKTIGNWENGRNITDLSLFEPLCNELGITINELIKGEEINKANINRISEENIINTINYTNRKLKSKNYYIGFILIVFGFLTSITAVAIFPSESSWGSIYSILGVIISFLGVSRFTKRLSYIMRVICNYGFFIVFVLILMLIDFIGVINIKQAPRFSYYTVSSDDTIYYDTLFYDVVRCNKDRDNEVFIIYKNQKYDKNNIQIYCR